ncbi:WAT1-related protein At1g68170-like [Arachis stenosperma]|uniref:WAT1-related protein At1g68170-like n=1 Tax=Arachis stenosperma TaxID=217475 RepID=UPI0025AC91E9|nr:WAT1-related protein At1g68170-like [Arachis stenosperma]
MTGIGGAMLITFYRGVKVKMLSFHINLFNQRNGGGTVHSSHSGGRLFLMGAMLAFFNNASYVLWPIIQAKRDFSQWKLGWNVRLLIIAYAGIVVSGVMVAVISWLEVFCPCKRY